MTIAIYLAVWVELHWVNAVIGRTGRTRVGDGCEVTAMGDGGRVRAQGATRSTGSCPPIAPQAINGWPLPQRLVHLIATGRWRFPPPVLPAAFQGRAPAITLYGPDALLHENACWRRGAALFLGARGGGYRPGAIDPGSSLLIGDAGRARDRPLALDYRPVVRGQAGEPPVAIACWPPGLGAVRWVWLAPDVSTLAAWLGL